MSQPPGHHPSGHPRVRNPDAGARVACIVIAAVAASCVIAALSNKPDARPGVGPPGQGQSAGPNAGGGSSSGGSDGGSSLPRPTVTKAYLEAHLPIPPGGKHYDGEDQVPDHEVWIQAPGTLAQVEAFYAAAMPKVDPGLTCHVKNTIKDDDGRLLGGTCFFDPKNEIDLGYLQIRQHVEGQPRGVIFVQGLFGS